VQSLTLVFVLQGLFWFGWLLVLFSTTLIDHFDLFGLKQVWKYFGQAAYDPPAFKTPGPYRFVRHPIYLGFLIAFWSTPRMTLGHLFFSVMTTAYILLAIQFEERDLISFHGEGYKVYRSGVSMLVPWPSKRKQP
jgi:protein-S-isoprenylcysteine O-methyltransferase Ste14